MAGPISEHIPLMWLTSLRAAHDTRERAISMDTCKVVDGDAIIAGEVSADVEVSCAVL